MTKFLRNQKGNSILLILGMMSVVGLGYTNIATSQNSTITHMILEKAQRYQADAYLSLIDSIVRNPTACAASFSGTTPTGTIPVINSEPGTPVFTVGQTLGGNRSNSGRLVIESMEWAPVGSPSGHEINITFRGIIDDKERRYNRSINIMYSLAGTTIDNCSVAQFANLVDACDALGGIVVGTDCTELKDPGSSTFDGSVSAQAINVAGSGTIGSGTITTTTTSASLQSTGNMTVGNFNGNTITSSNRVIANSINVSTNMICSLAGCQSWVLRECGVNQYMYAIGSDGSIACANW